MESLPTIYYRPLDVRARLAELGLSQEILWEAVYNGAAYAAECTLNDPANLRGLLAWGKTTRQLRDQLLPLGWTRHNTQNYPTTVHPSGAWAIAVSSGNSLTGDRDQIPSNRVQKGPATKQVVQPNQLSFSMISPEFAPMLKMQTTWLLLYYFDEDEDRVRAELSLPARMNNDGFVDEWQQRIILPPYSMPPSDAESVVPDSDLDFDDGIDVPVQMRS